jgi:hypothetical protein
MIAKAFTPFLGVKAFMIMAEMQLVVCFSTSFRDHEGFATLVSIESFTIMDGDAGGAGGWYEWGWRGKRG